MGEEADAIGWEYTDEDIQREQAEHDFYANQERRSEDRRIKLAVDKALRDAGVVKVKANKKYYPNPKMVTVKCKACRDDFEAREADRARGWGKFCSKSCKASYQKNGQNAYGKIKAHRYFLDHPYDKKKYKEIVNQE